MLSNVTGCVWKHCSKYLATATVALSLIAGIAVHPNSLFGRERDWNPRDIYACVQVENGQTRIVGENDPCRKSEVPVHWAVVGPQGPSGPAGPMGPAGPAGPAGKTGPSGPAGVAGPVGPAGATGPVGLTGAMGPAGSAGPTGLAGATGPAGAAGPAGAIGPTGPAGATGPAGPAGQDGATGLAGPQGPKGDPGTLSFAIVSQLPDVRINSLSQMNNWSPVPGRIVSLNKVSNSSKLRITYQDTLGTRAATFNGCQWRILVDGVALTTFSEGDLEIPSMGWRINNAAHVAWGFDIPMGSHLIRVDILRTLNATDCLSGWNTIGNFLSVEEIP